MDIIPVIDLKDGVVVQARRGERKDYRPITTPLAEGSAPAEVLKGLRRVFPFRKIYLADLNAITGEGDHRAEIEELTRAFPDVEFWVDNGIGTPAAAEDWLRAFPGRLVLGSESQRDLTVPAALRSHPRVVLSLDFRGALFQGPPALLETPALWPEAVIVMTLARIGAGEGPDFARFRQVRALRPEGAWYAAGGVRNADDVRALHASGASGVLVATALHSGALDLGALKDIMPAGEG
jgi:phosphoribosylformimino-5-aminoimidazole carboxamide ribotide isomerase